MNISVNWLNDYLKTDLNAVEISEILTSVGLEVSGIEKFESVRGGLKGLVIGEVTTCIPHPDSDHLNLTTVNLGDGTETPIVCGAPNVAAGQKVVVATIGTILYDGDKEFEIKKSKIRGKESEGMICSEVEIGLGTDHSGIMVLPENVTPGTPAAEYFEITTDYVIGVDITPNRISGASHMGVARDLAAYLTQKGDKTTYTLPSVENFKVDNHRSLTSIEVLRPEACKRYAGVCIEGIEIKASPEWLRTRLKAIGLNPINNVVDITNYVLFELGQPLHAFDKDKIAGDKVVIRSYPTGTPFITLDGVERKLDENDLMVCDAEKPMCIAGVFGGIDSGITPQTTNVFLESACFDPVFVRKTARRHGLNTDASFHFERGTDPNIVIYALKRAALMIKEIAGGEISSEIIDIYPDPVKDTEINIEYDYINRLLGKEIDKESIRNILASLEIKIMEEDDSGLLLHVPPLHVDVKQPADIVEEILRIYGFNQIEDPEKLSASVSFGAKPDDHTMKNMVGDLLAANGFFEMMSNSLTKAEYYTKGNSFNPEQTVMICNPLSSDLNAMRQTLLYGGLEAINRNINRKRNDLKLFEFGKEYTFNRKETDNPIKQYREVTKCALFITGNKTALSWNSREIKSDFYTVKAYGEMVLKRMGLNPDLLVIEENTRDILLEGLDYLYQGKHIMSVGNVHPLILKSFDIEQDVCYAELSWETILSVVKNNKTLFQALPKYPAVKRDLALLLDKKVTFKEVRDIAWRTEKKLLKAVNLFDVYEGEKLGEGKKSYAVSYTLLDEEKTLTDKQIDKIMNKLIGAYKHLLKAEIR